MNELGLWHAFASEAFATEACRFFLAKILAKINVNECYEVMKSACLEIMQQLTHR